MARSGCVMGSGRETKEKKMIEQNDMDRPRYSTNRLCEEIKRAREGDAETIERLVLKNSQMVHALNKITKCAGYGQFDIISIARAALMEWRSVKPPETPEEQIAFLEMKLLQTEQEKCELENQLDSMTYDRDMLRDHCKKLVEKETPEMDETYYTEGKDAEYFENLPTKELVEKLSSIVQRVYGP